VRDHRPSDPAFGLTVGPACIAIGGLSWWRGVDAVAVALAAFGTGLVLAALIAPQILRAPSRIWWRFAQLLAWFNTRVLLTVFFFVVITPAGILMRLCGRHPLQPPLETSWLPSAARRRESTHYDHLF
jgi:hypothetical protein